MSQKRHEPIAITPNFYQLGTHSFPVYLSLGDDGMLIEGGTGATFKIIVEQIEELGIDPGRIKYLALTHTHPDHIGALPHLKRLWPHLKVVASPVAAKLLKNERVVKDFIGVDRSVTEIMISKGEIAESPPALDNYTFEVDVLVEEGDRLDLGSGIVWTVYNTPGHSPCHISLSEEKEGILVVGDATGFYVPEKETFWPNYFHSLEAYCNNIRKLAAIPARMGVLSHNGVINGDLGGFFQKAIDATESYHREMLERLGNGEDSEKVALEKAKWVNTITDIQTFEVMHNLAKLMIMRSQSEADNDNLFATT